LQPIVNSFGESTSFPGGARRPKGGTIHERKRGKVCSGDQAWTRCLTQDLFFIPPRRGGYNDARIERPSSEGRR